MNSIEHKESQIRQIIIKNGSSFEFDFPAMIGNGYHILGVSVNKKTVIIKYVTDTIKEPMFETLANFYAICDTSLTYKDYLDLILENLPNPDAPAVGSTVDRKEEKLRQIITQYGPVEFEYPIMIGSYYSILGILADKSHIYIKYAKAPIVKSEAKTTTLVDFYNICITSLTYKDYIDLLLKNLCAVTKKEVTKKTAISEATASTTAKKRYYVNVHYDVCISVVVEAENDDEALDLAQELAEEEPLTSGRVEYLDSCITDREKI